MQYAYFTWRVKQTDALDYVTLPKAVGLLIINNYVAESNYSDRKSICKVKCTCFLRLMLNPFKTNRTFHKCNTDKAGWSILYIERLQVITKKTHIYAKFSEYFFVLANSVDLDEMPHYAVFHLGLHCLPKYRFKYRGGTGYNLKVHTFMQRSLKIFWS